MMLPLYDELGCEIPEECQIQFRRKKVLVCGEPATISGEDFLKLKEAYSKYRKRIRGERRRLWGSIEEPFLVLFRDITGMTGELEV